MDYFKEIGCVKYFKDKTDYNKLFNAYEQEVIKCGEWIEKYQELDQQYNAVVAQNKSLQGELRLYKKMVDILIEHRELSNRTGIKYISFEGAKQQALQKLEAEND